MTLEAELARLRPDTLAEAQDMVAAAIGAIRRPAHIVDIVLVPIPTAATLQVGDQVYFRLGLNGVVTILAWSMAGTVGGASVAGTITLDILVGTTLATVATICGSHKPTLTAQAELADQTPATDWTVQIPDPRWIVARVSSTGGTLEVVSLTLRCAVG